MPDATPAASLTRFIVKDLFAVRTVHIIYGPSGAGKSILLNQILLDWANARLVFDHPSYPAPFCLMAVNRNKADVEADIRHVGGDLTQIPHVSFLEAGHREECTIEAVLTLALNAVPNLRVLFIDGLDALCTGNPISQRDVVNFMRNVGFQCMRHNITIIGTCPANKNQTEQTLLTRLSGATGWTQIGSTKISIMQTSPENPTDPERCITLFVPRQPVVSLTYAFGESGMLEFKSDASLQPALDNWLATQPSGAEVDSESLLVLATQLDVSKPTLYRWLQDQVKLGTLKRIARGQYVVTPTH